MCVEFSPENLNSGTYSLHPRHLFFTPQALILVEWLSLPFENLNPNSYFHTLQALILVK